jgi:hypothetical protein
MRFNMAEYVLAAGACVFLLIGCATTQVKDLQDENLALNQRISELEAELAAQQAQQDQEGARSGGGTSGGGGGGGASNSGETSAEALRAEIDRLKFMNELLLEAAGTGAQTLKPEETALAVGRGRIRATPSVKNNSFLGFLAAENRPDDRGRGADGSAQAVGVSWIDAARYCNWLSAQWQYDAYYSITGTDVQLNLSGRQNGYRLPSQAELDAGVRNGFLNMDSVSRIGLLSAEPNRAYRYDRARNSLVPLDASLPVGNIGFMVVRNEN